LDSIAYSIPHRQHQSANAAVVFQVIDAVEDKEIDGVLEGLDPLVMDLLMKYVYKGLSVSCSLAGWLVSRDGIPPLRLEFYS
jgi:hypothetical protein